MARIFNFQSFNHALAFTQRLGKIAIEKVHYLILLVESIKVTVIWWITGIRELHQKGFRMAIKTNSIFKNTEEYSLIKDQSLRSEYLDLTL